MTATAADATAIMQADRTLERELETFFRKRVRLLGGVCLKIAPTEAGVPDRMVLFPGGHIFLVELKRAGGRLRPIQIVWHNRAAEMGHTVVVLEGKAEIVEWLRQVVDSLGPQNKKPGRAATR